MSAIGPFRQILRCHHMSAYGDKSRSGWRTLDMT